MGNMLILTREPFVGFRPEDVREWLENHPEESNYAMALAEVHVKSVCVGEEYEDSGDRWALYAAEKWEELECFITHKIEEILALEGPSKYSNAQGSHNRILPFMKRNGYRDGSGWWIKDEKSEEETGTQNSGKTKNP